MVDGFAGALQQALPGTAQRILEVGCGEGRQLTAVGTRYRGAELVGLDLPDVELEEHWDDVPSEMVQGSALALPFADQSFDLVMAIEVLEHLPDPEQALREISRCRVRHRCPVGAVGAGVASRQPRPRPLRGHAGQYARAHSTLLAARLRPTRQPAPRGGQRAATGALDDGPSPSATVTALARTIRVRGRDVPLAVVAPLAVAVGIRIVFALTDNVVAPDEAAYLGTGENIWAGRGITYRGNPELHFPPLLPILLGALAKLTPEPHDATVILTFIASTVLVVVVGALAWRVAGRRAGILAMWAAALSPALSVTFTRGAGGSEAPYALLLFAAALVAVGRGRWDEPPTWRAAAGVGALVGAAYLVRPEGIATVAVFGAILAVRAVGGRLQRDAVTAANLRRIGALGLACLAGLLVFAGPYVAFLHSHTGSWSLTAKSVDVNIDAWTHLAAQDRTARDAELYKLDESGYHTVRGKTSLTALAREHPREYLGIVGENLQQLYKSLLSPNTTVMPGWRLFALPLFPFALLGLWRFRSRPAVLAVTGIMALSLVTVLGFFVLNRYLPPVAVALCVLAGIGLASLSESRRRLWVAIGLAASVCSLLGYFEGAHGPQFVRERPDIKIAGLWLRDRIPPTATVMTRSTSLPYYLPKNRLVIPPVTDVDRLHKFSQYRHVEYFIFDPTTQLYRPDLAPLLDGRDHRADGFELVHTFTVEDRTTVIFKVVPRQPA